MNAVNGLLLAALLVLLAVCAWVGADSWLARRRAEKPYDGRHRAVEIEPIPDVDRTQPIHVGVLAFAPMTYRVTAYAPPVPPTFTCHNRAPWRIPAALPAGASQENQP